MLFTNLPFYSGQTVESIGEVFALSHERKFRFLRVRFGLPSSINLNFCMLSFSSKKK